MRGRGAARNSKQTPRRPSASSPEFEELKEKCLAYLKREVEVFTSVGGNYKDVVQLLKQIRALEAESEVQGPSQEEQRFRIG